MEKFITVNRRANVSQNEALEALADKYPQYRLTAFDTVEGTSGQLYTAKLKLAEFPPVDPAGRAEEEAETLETPMDDSSTHDLDEMQDEESHKEEKSDSQKLNEIIDLIHTMMEGDGDGDADDMGMEDAAPVGGGAPRELPPPVKPHMDSAPGMGGGSQMFGSRNSFVAVRSDDLDDGGRQMTVKQLVDEANREYGRFGFRVAKIERRGAKVVTALKRG